jgi:hypothetical protein
VSAPTASARTAARSCDGWDLNTITRLNVELDEARKENARQDAEVEKLRAEEKDRRREIERLTAEIAKLQSKEIN